MLCQRTVRSLPSNPFLWISHQNTIAGIPSGAAAATAVEDRPQMAQPSAPDKRTPDRPAALPRSNIYVRC